jgi:hypothetical protein
VLRRLLPVLLVASALLVPSAPASAAADPGAAELQFLVLLNKQRAASGLPMLVLDPALSGVARGWSAHMATQSIGHNPGLRQAVEASVTGGWSRLGENVGVGGDAVGLHRAFWDSPGHRSNMLGPYNRVGIGVVVGGDGNLRVTVDFVQGPALAGSTGVSPCRSTGYVLDAHGGVHAAGGAAGLRQSAYWPGWDVARDLSLPANGTQGQVLDAFGGLHAVGGASRLRQTGYWPGWDVARAVAVQPGGGGAYVLDAFGGLHPAGSARRVRTNGYWPGLDIARDAQLLPGRNDAGYVLDAQGGLKRFGTGVPAPRLTWRDGGGTARSFTFLSNGRGGYGTDSRGALHPFAVGSNPLPAAVSSNVPLAGARGALLAGSGPVAVTGGGAHIGLQAGCASPGAWGGFDLVRAVVPR